MADQEETMADTLVVDAPAGRGKASGTDWTKARVEQAKAKAQRKAKPKGKSKAKGKAKGKAKAKAKGRGKATAKAKAKPIVDEQEAAPRKAAPKAKAGGKLTLMQELKGRSPRRVVAEAEEQIAASHTNLESAEADVAALSRELEGIEGRMAAQAKLVEEAVGRETIALERLRAAKESRGKAAVGTQEAEQARSEALKRLTLLEFEVSNQGMVKDLFDARQRAQAAADMAKRTLAESKLREKEAQEAVRLALAEQREKEDLALKEHADADKGSAEARRQQASGTRADQKEVLAEIAALEKAKVQREKLREQRWREAAGLTKVRQLKALAMEPHFAEVGEKRTALPTLLGSLAKVSRSVDVD